MHSSSRQLRTGLLLLAVGLVIVLSLNARANGDEPAQPPAQGDEQTELPMASEPAVREPASPDLLVAIAVPDRRGGRVVELIDERSHFHVVVTNVSEHPVRLWREWCSWGYYNLSFEITLPGGKKLVAKKHARPWKKNYPDFCTIEPGNHLVIEVYPNADDWKDSGLGSIARSDPGEGRKVTLQAIYSIEADQHAGEEGVWTGRVESELTEIVIHK